MWGGTLIKGENLCVKGGQYNQGKHVGYYFEGR